MGILKELMDSLHFICTFQLWRMAILWTLSLVYSYLKLYLQNFSLHKHKPYTRLSPKDHSYASMPLSRPVCVITGASSGLGAAAAHALANEGFYVVLVGRSLERLSKVTSDIRRSEVDACVKAFEVDMTSFESIVKFKRSLKQWLLDSNLHPSIQLLINNAGILATTSRITSEGYDQWTEELSSLYPNQSGTRLQKSTSTQNVRVNVKGHVLFVVLYPSSSSCFQWVAVCLLLFSYELHRRAYVMDNCHKLSVVAVDPGAVKTEIMREFPWGISHIAFISLKALGLLQTPEYAVGSILDASLALPETSGEYFFGGKGRTLTSSPLSYNSKISKDLWDTSNDLFQELQEALEMHD